MEFIDHYQHDYENNGGIFTIRGLENHVKLSNHRLATRKLSKK